MTVFSCCSNKTQTLYPLLCIIITLKPLIAITSTLTFHASIIKCDVDFSINTDDPKPAGATMNSCEEMTMDEIFNGKGKYYPGLIPLVYAYLDYIRYITIRCCAFFLFTLLPYDLIQCHVTVDRASCDLQHAVLWHPLCYLLSSFGLSCSVLLHLVISSKLLDPVLSYIVSNPIPSYPVVPHPAILITFSLLSCITHSKEADFTANFDIITDSLMIISTSFICFRDRCDSETFKRVDQYLQFISGYVYQPPVSPLSLPPLSLSQSVRLVKCLYIDSRSSFERLETNSFLSNKTFRLHPLFCPVMLTCLSVQSRKRRASYPCNLDEIFRDVTCSL